MAVLDRLEAAQAEGASLSFDALSAPSPGPTCWPTGCASAAVRPADASMKPTTSTTVVDCVHCRPDLRR